MNRLFDGEHAAAELSEVAKQTLAADAMHEKGSTGNSASITEVDVLDKQQQQHPLQTA